MKIPNKKLEIGNWKLKIPLQRGYTWPELVVIIGVMFTLLGLISINLFIAQHNASTSTAVENVVADLKSQQTNAMTGATEGRASGDNYGVHFNTSSYVLFHGSSYNSSDSSNLVINLDAGIQFSSITFPNSNVIFLQGSGEVSGFANGSNTVILQSTQGGAQKTITINKYGVVTQVQ